jgi:hypothetical protein
MSLSEFDVNAQADNRDRAAISIVPGVVHELVIQADEKRLCQASMPAERKNYKIRPYQ